MTDPVQQRFRALEEQWERFLDSGARVGCWRIEDGDQQVFDAFFEALQHESSQRGELFIELSTPFRDPERHGAALVDELASHYRELEPSLHEEGLAASWTKAPSSTDLAALSDNGLAFVRAHRPLFDTLVLVLAPERVDDPGAWELWLARAANAIAEPHLKLVVLDSIAEPLLGHLIEKHNDRILFQDAALSMADAYVEVSQRAGGLSTPAGAFRHAFVQMSRCIGARDVGGAEGFARTALDAANQAGWLHLVVAVECALATVYGSLERHVDAIACYHRAQDAAQACAPEPYATRLELTAILGRGGAFLAAGAFHEAAKAYLGGVNVAQSVPDARLELESYRMAAYSWECAGEWDSSWQEGLSALGVGKRMDQEARRTSTLAYAADGVCRVCQRPEYVSLAPRIEREIVNLLGAEWRQLLDARDSS